MIIFGHRGAPGYPRLAENTKGSFRKALDSGATGLEFDVRRCGDGRLVVIHDDIVDRTTDGCGRVRDLTTRLEDRAFLEVAEDNGPARALYARHGWTEVGQREQERDHARHASSSASTPSP